MGAPQIRELRSAPVVPAVILIIDLEVNLPAGQMQNFVLNSSTL
jgi:hypothetical protein